MPGGVVLKKANPRRLLCSLNCFSADLGGAGNKCLRLAFFRIRIVQNNEAPHWLFRFGRFVQIEPATPGGRCWWSGAVGSVTRSLYR